MTRRTEGELKVDSREAWIHSQCKEYDKILDVGAADGWVWKGCNFPNLVLLDINEYLPGEFPRLVGDAHSLPVQDNMFDVVVLTECLEHVHNPILVLREASRVAREKVVFTVPDEYHWSQDHKPFYTMEQHSKDTGKTQVELIRQVFDYVKINDTKQAGHNRWYTKEKLESQLNFLGLPYQIQTIAYEGWSWFCGTITKKAAPENIFEVRPDTNKEWTRPPKILCISTTVYPVSPELRYGGIERLCYLISEELNHRGFRVSVVAPEGSLLSEEIVHISTGPCITTVEGEWEVYKYYNQALNDFDAIISFDHRHLAMLKQDLPGIAFIWHPPSVMQFPLPSYNIACLSELQKQELWQYQGLKAQVIDPHCVDPMAYLLQAESNGRYLFIGRLNPGKGVRNAIKLCKELGVGLDIIGGLGSGDPPEYLDWVKGNCDAEQIVYHGNVSDSIKFQFIARAKAGLHAVNYPEPSSHKTIELLCGGLPIVAYDIGANKEIIDHEVNGFVVQSEEQFKECMPRVNSLNRDLIRERALKRWSVEATVDRLIPTLKEVAEGLRWK